MRAHATEQPRQQTLSQQKTYREGHVFGVDDAEQHMAACTCHQALAKVHRRAVKGHTGFGHVTHEEERHVDRLLGNAESLCA